MNQPNSRSLCFYIVCFIKPFCKMFDSHSLLSFLVTWLNAVYLSYRILIVIHGYHGSTDIHLSLSLGTHCIQVGA